MLNSNINFVLYWLKDFVLRHSQELKLFDNYSVGQCIACKPVQNSAVFSHKSNRNGDYKNAVQEIAIKPVLHTQKPFFHLVKSNQI